MLQFKENISLKPFNTFGIDVNTKYFIEIFSENDLILLLKSDIFNTHSHLILGGGSNVLLTKHIEGLVIKISIKKNEILKDDANYNYVKSGSGVLWHDFVLFCLENNLFGVENLSLIPGTVGAAPMQNIGAYGVELKDVFQSLEALEIETSKITTFSGSDCEFGYRESVFKNKYKNKYIIISVTFKLPKKTNYNISYGAIKDEIQKFENKEINAKNISLAVINIRKSKLPDPKILGNSGSFFKNPEIKQKDFEVLKAKYPLIPHYPAANNQIKLAAGWLIEQCGWKGKKVGNTGSHKDQALVLVNYGNASGLEIWNLAMDIQKSVLEKFNINITPEVNII